MPTRTQRFEQLLENFQAIRRALASGSPRLSDKALGRITQSQWGVLRVIALKGHASVKDIAGQLGVSSSAATQLVDGLVGNGHLKRKDDPDDRRLQYIEFSAGTTKKMHLLRKSRLQRLITVFSPLTDAELEQYLRLSGKVAGHLTHS